MKKMKKIIISLKSPAITLIAKRLVLVIGIIVFTVSIGNSQVDKTYVSKDPSKEKPAGNIQPVNNAPVQNPKADLIYENMGEHAPSVNDPDFRNKMEEWAKNYPEEFNAWMIKSNESNPGLKTSDYPAYNQTSANIHQKIAEHAPEMGDPNYEAKKQEWMKNYPEEYKECMSKASSNNGQNIKTSQKTNQPSANVQQKVAEHAPDINDPDYDAKKLEWMKNYPEEYNALIEKSANTNTGLNTGTNNSIQKTPELILDNNTDARTTEQIENNKIQNSKAGSEANGTTRVEKKPHIKVAEHAPYFDDPDYTAKKAEWVKNYPEEYEQVLNSENGQQNK